MYEHDVRAILKIVLKATHTLVALQIVVCWHSLVNEI